MANDEEIVVRSCYFKTSPDVEHYVETLSKKGVLEKLSKEGSLNAETIRGLALGKMCDIFIEDVGRTLESGDIIIFGDTATFEVFRWRRSIPNLNIMSSL